MNYKSLLILALIFMPLASVADCPLGAKETHLTFTRVMRNFGRFTLKADSISLNATNPWGYEPVSEEQMAEAIEKLKLAIDCADAVLKNPTGDLIPSKVSFIVSEKEKADFMDDLIYFMTDFKDGLNQYLEIFKKLQTQKSEDRKFDEANEKRQELDDLVDRAHKKI